MPNDPILAALLTAADEATASHHLEQLIEREARPLVRRIVRSQLGGGQGAAGAADLEDVESAVLVRLAGKFLELRGDGEAAPIESLSGYVAVSAYNGCHAFLRRRFPERSRLLARLRYLLERDERFALWSGPAQEWLAGLAAWRGLATGPRKTAPPGRGRVGHGRAAGLAEVIETILRDGGGPLRLEELLDRVAAELGLADELRGPAGGDRDEPRGEAADPAPLAIERLAHRQFLTRAWQEIRLLPRRQRVALLLNLRDPHGGEMLGLLVAAGIAESAEIAAVIEIEPAELDRLWPELPRDDQWIADFLGLTRRQVINLRKCARERLARRLPQR